MKWVTHCYVESLKLRFCSFWGWVILAGGALRLGFAVDYVISPNLHLAC